MGRPSLPGRVGHPVPAAQLDLDPGTGDSAHTPIYQGLPWSSEWRNKGSKPSCFQQVPPGNKHSSADPQPGPDSRPGLSQEPSPASGGAAHGSAPALEIPAELQALWDLFHCFIFFIFLLIL